MESTIVLLTAARTPVLTALQRLPFGELCNPGLTTIVES